MKAAMRLPLLVASLLLLRCYANAEAGPATNTFSSLNESLSETSKTFLDSLSKAYELMKTSRLCQLVPLSGIQFKTVKLCFFFGPRKDDYHSVPLSEARTLLDHKKWKKDLPIALYTFGWLHTPTISFSQEIVKAYHANGEFNFIIVDWSIVAHLEYAMTVTTIPHIGKRVAEALQDLLDAGAKLGHIVGHSLGAQISGHIGRNLKERPNFLIGLDPAGPLFYKGMFKCQEPMSSKDGVHVVAVHTDWGVLGANTFIGPVDIMPNNGRRLQPGCNMLDWDSYGPLCSHTHALFFWCEVIRNPESIVGRLCPSWEAFQDNKCSNNDLLKFVQPSNATGVFYLKTRDKPPFGIGRSGV